MDCVEGLNRLTRKRLSGAIDDLLSNSQDMPMRSRGRQLCTAVRRLCLRQLTQCNRTYQYAIALNECQIGRNDDFGAAKQLANFGRGLLVQEPGQNSA